VTNREKKQWLMRGWKLEGEIKALEEAKKRALERAASVTAALSEDRVQTSEYNRQEEAITRYIDYELLIDRQTDRLIDIRTEITKAIFALESSTLRTLLLKRYLEFKPWERIAEEMGYDADHVRKKLHSAALTKIDPERPGEYVV